MSDTAAPDYDKLLGKLGLAITDALPTLIAYVDRDLVYRYCNASYKRWFGIDREDIINKKTVSELVGKETFEQIRPFIDRVFNKGKESGYEMPLALPNGLNGLFRSIYSPHINDDGEVIGLVAMVENFTESRHHESFFEQYDQPVRPDFNGNQFGTWTVEISRAVAELDPALARLFRLPGNETDLPLDRFVELIAPEHRERIAVAVRNALDDKSDFSEQYKANFPDGTTEWFSSYGKRHRDEHGVAQRVVGVTHLITEQKDAEKQLRSLNHFLEARAARQAEALQMSEANLLAIVSSAADAILTIDEQQTILSANPSAKALFGSKSKPAPLIGTSITPLMPNDTSTLRSATLQNHSAHEGPINRTTVARRIDGSEFAAEFSVTRATGVPFSVVLLRDISERRELESMLLRATEEEKSRIARDLHDGLGSLLGGISCLAKTVETELTASAHPLASRAKDIADATQQSVTTARRLAHGLNAVGSEANALVEALREFTQAADSSHPDFTIAFDCNDPVDITDRVVANHLFRIAQEAITNAIRHSGGDSIGIKLRKDEHDIVLQVSDNGAGLDASDNPVAPDGFGLRTMRYRSSEMNGRFDIESTATGTTVTCQVSL